MRFRRVLCAVLLTWGCGDGDGPPGAPGEAGPPGEVGESGGGCTALPQDDGSVNVVCDDGTVGTIAPPTAMDAGADACTVERTADTITVTCPGGSKASFPVPSADAGAPCSVQQADGGAVTVTCANGSVTVLAPPSATTEAGTPLQSRIIVGPTRAACGACHDSKAARGHYEAMTVEVDGELQETCGTCHNETSLEPVTRVHARPEFGAPGLRVQIGAVSIDPGTRRATARLTLTDTSNAPVVRTGLSFSLVIAKVAEQTRAAFAGVVSPPVRPPLAGPYESYITRAATQVDTTYYPLAGNPPRVSTQPTAERGDGTFVEISPGVYDYTFKFALPVGYDPNLTHMIALYVTRTVNGVRFVANAEKSFVPADSGATPLVRAAVGDTACNSCHNPLSAHGGSRQDLQLCLTCHTQGATDPESGNSIDFNVMVHRIHMGKNLPSVKAGTPYRIIGNSASLHDFSAVGFPQDIKNCQTCHNTADDRWVSNGRQEACTSCHDDIYNPGKHIGTLSPQTTCGNANCHSEGGLAPDAREAHVTSLNNVSSGVFDVEIRTVTVASADDAPVVRIRARTGTVATGALTPVTSADALQTLNVFFNGPNTSYRTNGHNITQFAKSALVNLTHDSGNPGEFTFTLPKTLRELTTGGIGDPEVDSYTLSLRAAYDPTPATVDNDRIDMLKNPTKEFGAGEEIAARLPVVDTAKCNSCHANLQAHGGGTLARSVEQCAMCHTATMDTVARQSANKVAGPTTSLRFSTMVHRIHAGHLAEQPYIAYGFSPMAPYPRLDFSDIAFPGALQVCTTCHVGNSYQLPLPFTTEASQTVTLDANGQIVGQ